jgi:hypothetical protein
MYVFMIVEGSRGMCPTLSIVEASVPSVRYSFSLLATDRILAESLNTMRR